MTTRVRRQAQSLQVRSRTRIVNGKAETTRTRVNVRYAGPGGAYQLQLTDAGEEVDSESEDEQMGGPEDSTGRLLRLGGDSVRAGVTSVISEAGEDARTELLDLGREKRTEGKTTSKTEKAWLAAKELVDTEERYVGKLHLLDQEFRVRVEALGRGAGLSKTKLGLLFSNLSSIYQFHNSHFLPPLLERRRDWQAQQTIADVIVRQAPFLKMYSEYTNNFKHATKTFDEAMRKSKDFAAIVAEVERLPDCDNLPLAAHLICPVQRIMRYHLLLEQYLKALPDPHPDREQTQLALKAVLTGANHANEMMNQIERYRQVIAVGDSLKGQIVGLVTPVRELLKQGDLTKISARTSARDTRRIFLVRIFWY